MNRKAKTTLLVAAFALFIGIAVFAYNTLGKRVPPQNNIYATQDGGKASQTGQDGEDEKIKAPDFTVLDTDGNSVKLSELFGKPIVLNFCYWPCN